GGTMTADVYIQSVMDRVPQGMPLRDQIAMELRSHIAERLEHGQSLDDVLRQLGDPLTLAESYLASVPLQSADALPRLAAKVLDALFALFTERHQRAFELLTKTRTVVATPAA